MDLGLYKIKSHAEITYLRIGPKLTFLLKQRLISLVVFIIIVIIIFSTLTQRC